MHIHVHNRGIPLLLILLALNIRFTKLYLNTMSALLTWGHQPVGRSSLEHSDSKGRTLHNQDHQKNLTKEKLNCHASPSEVFEEGQPNRLKYSTLPWTQTRPAQSGESESLRSASSTVLSDRLTGSPKQLDKTQGQITSQKAFSFIFCSKVTKLNQTSAFSLKQGRFKLSEVLLESVNCMVIT